MNKLFFGDNLEILKSSIPSESVDLIYLDPPFNSGKNYNILFKPEKETTKGATAQIQTFEDTWHWGKQAEDEYQGIIDGTICKEQPSQAIINLIQSYRSYLGECPMMAYLAMMTPRLIELHRVLKGTGSFYLHCDPTASHYLKLLLDAIFGIKNFRNEIVWHYRKWSTKQAQFCSNHDILFFYSKTDTKDRVFVHPFMDRAESTKKRFGNSKIISGHDENGRRLPSETENFDSEGVPMDDVWEIGRVPPIKQLYSTQKPEILLERIIKASSNVGDLILDPFCGCGTATVVAQTLNRNWIGIDITYLAIDIIKKRFEKNGIIEGKDFKVLGEPEDPYSAEKLAALDPFQFQFWAISKIPGAMPNTTKTGDKGIDGFINFVDPSKANKAGRGLISVKGTKNVNPVMIRELIGTVEKHKADFGVLLLLNPPTSGMKKDAISEGYYQFMGTKKIPKIQILCVDDLFKYPLPIELPGTIYNSFKTPEIKEKSPELF